MLPARARVTGAPANLRRARTLAGNLDSKAIAAADTVCRCVTPNLAARRNGLKFSGRMRGKRSRRLEQARTLSALARPSVILAERFGLDVISQVSATPKPQIVSAAATTLRLGPLDSLSRNRAH
jgi:hypothetical protein